jgi:hypothetical protein
VFEFEHYLDEAITAAKGDFGRRPAASGHELADVQNPRGASS